MEERKGGPARKWPETRLWSRLWDLATVGPCALAVPKESQSFRGRLAMGLGLRFSA